MKVTSKMIIIIGLIMSGCSTTRNDKLPLKSLGLNVTIEKKIFQWYDSLNPQGEGYTLEIYKFKEKEDLNKIMNNNFPISTEIRKDWGIVKWSDNQLENKDIHELLFNYRIIDDKAKSERANLKKLMADNGNFISYYYKDVDGYINAIEFYFIDMKGKKIYRCLVIT